MFGILVGATVLIPAVILLQRLTRGWISMRLRYSLWLIVALRLILPLNIGSSLFSVMNLAERVMPYAFENVSVVLNRGDVVKNENRRTYGDLAGGKVRRTGGDASDMETRTDLAGNAVGNDAGGDGKMQVAVMQAAETMKDAAEAMMDKMELMADGTGVRALDGVLRAESMAGQQAAWAVSTGMTAGGLLWLLWVAGMTVVGSYMLACQVRFVSYLHRERKAVMLDGLPEPWARRLSEKKIRLYEIAGLPSPCMAGRSIYITPQLWGDEGKLEHVLAHEYAHALQGDALWALVRSVLCVVYWFHPFVWAAAYAARQDSELACDERAIGLLGEQERFAYGRTLLGMVCEGHRRHSYDGVVMTMEGNAKRVKERISMIAKKGKRNRGVTALVMVTAVFMCGCAFTGAKAQETDGVAAQEVLEAAMAVEAEEVEHDESRMIQERFDEIENEKQETVEEKRYQSQEAEKREKAENLAIQKRLDEIEAEWIQVTQQEFEETLYGMDDTGLGTAKEVDRMEYYDFCFNGAECPMEDATWYLAARSEHWGIDFYGLYTDKFGCRGVKIMIDGDVNTFDMPWNPAMFQSSIQVLQAERTEDGSLRSFVFKICLKNDSYNEVWDLYVADRYDTGTIDLNSFGVAEYQEQFKDMAGFLVDQENQKVDLIYDGDVVAGSIDISEYTGYTVEGVVWDGSAAGFSGDNEGQLSFSTCIGLKLAETDEIQYHGLSVVRCPVDIGTWGERNFRLGNPSVDEEYVNSSLRTLDDRRGTDNAG